MTIFDAIRAVPNVSEPLPNVYTAGQPTAEQLAAFKASGGTTVLDLREPHEPRGFDEAAEAARLGLEYVPLPVGPRTMTDDTLDAVRATLRDATGPVLFHCGTANRVGGAMLPVLILDHGMDEDDAVQAAMRIGLRAQEYAVWGIDYARRHGED
jgi:uncharacterized protein (TIGR01244 family)